MAFLELKSSKLFSKRCQHTGAIDKENLRRWCETLALSGNHQIKVHIKALK
jgi:hypothetical protein